MSVRSCLYVGRSREYDMLAIKLYISALAILFLALVIVSRGLGILEATIITCAILFLIIDSRTDLQTLKGELRLWQELEERVAALLR